MATNEERLRILTMIQEGKLSAEEGARLLEALAASEKPAVPLPPPEVLPPPPGGGPKWFRVRITDTDTGKTRVNIRLPINVISAGIKLGARFSAEVDGMDPEVLMNMIRQGETGQLVDVIDEEDGEHVEVFLE